MFYVIMTPLVICAILSVIWCIRSEKDTPAHTKSKTPKIERIDSSYANHKWKEKVDYIYSKFVACGMENISKNDFAKTLINFIHNNKHCPFTNPSTYIEYILYISNDLVLADLLKIFNVVDEVFLYVMEKLFRLGLDKDFFEDSIMKLNKSDIKNFVEYISTDYGIEGWALKQCYTKKYEADVLNRR